MSLNDTLMRTKSQFAGAVLTIGLFHLLGSVPLHGETWTDSSGKYAIEAEYAGVKGRNVVLRLPNGKFREVPIVKLSAISKARAKKLYEAARSTDTGPAVTPGSAAAKPASQASASTMAPSSPVSPGLQRKEADFAPPVPPVPPMPEFPENVSLQMTVNFIQEQVLAGHPEVLWYALPNDLRSELDSEEVRDAMQEGVKMQMEMQKPINDVAMKACEILIRKKQFVVNSQLMVNVPAEIRPMIQQYYDSATGLIYEVFNISFGAQDVLDHSISEYVNYHGPRIGGHLRQLSKVLPPGMIDQFTSKVIVNQTSSTTGTISFPSPEGGQEVVEFVSHEGRWMPKGFVAIWKEKGGTMAESMRSEYEKNKDQMQASMAQTKFAIGMFVGMIDQVLQPMLDATTQEEFDAAINKAMMTAAMMQGGGPGGPGGAPGPGGGIPGFGGPGAP